MNVKKVGSGQRLDFHCGIFWYCSASWLWFSERAEARWCIRALPFLVHPFCFCTATTKQYFADITLQAAGSFFSRLRGWELFLNQPFLKTIGFFDETSFY
jgi:hypothetical protein